MDNYPSPTPAIPTPCTPTSPTQFENSLAGFGKTLDPLISAAVAAESTNSVKANSARDTVCTSRDMTWYNNKAIKEYSLFSNCITISATKDAEELVATAKDILTKSTKVSDAYKAMADSIKAVNQKLEQVKTLSDKLSADISNPCNSEEQKLIKAAIAASPNNPGPNKKGLEASVAEIGAYAVKLNDRICELTSSSVKVSVINAFINVQSLKDAADNIKKGADDFVTDVDTNIKGLQTEYDTSRKTLADAQKAFSSLTIRKYKSIAAKQGLDWTKKLTDVDHLNCPVDGDKKLDELVQKATESFNDSCVEKPAAEEET